MPGISPIKTSPHLGPISAGGDAGLSNIYSLYFDNVNETVDAGDINELDGVSNFTIGARFKLGNIVTNSCIWAKHTNSSNRINLQFTVFDATHINMFVQLQSGSNAFLLKRLELAVDPEPEDWLQVIVAYDGTVGDRSTSANGSDACRIWIDGVEITTFDSFLGTFPATTAVYTSNFIWGDISLFAGYELTGWVNDGWVFSNTFTNAEAVEAWNGGAALDMTAHSAAASGVSHWRFGNNPGDNFGGGEWNLIDAFGNYNATSVNMEEDSREETAP